MDTNTPPSLSTVILTSVAISSVISGVFLMVNDWFRRRAERENTLIVSSVQLTKMRDEQIGEFLKHTKKSVKWPASLKTFQKTYATLHQNLHRYKINKAGEFIDTQKDEGITKDINITK